MSISNISEKVKIRLWGKSAGRCQYVGCNEPLWLDSLTKAEFNVAYIAHIIADSPKGPRGDAKLSLELKDDINNLMLMCDKHHRLIDKEDIEGHSVERLKAMKTKHEQRIELQTSLMVDARSHIVLYGANIGSHSSPVSHNKAAIALLPDRYPAENRSLELSLKNSSFQDHEKEYWVIEREHLQRQFAQIIKPRLAMGEVEHLSVFALAAQPLLIELGRLLSDIPAADVFQLHREPPNWLWQEHPDGFKYVVQKPENFTTNVAVNLSLSATIKNSRITSILGEDVSVWTLTVDSPNNDFLKSRQQLGQFRQKWRKLLDEIKSRHGDDVIINIFPAVPAAIAVEIGRTWMSKADLPLILYDQNRLTGGFSMAFDITTSRLGSFNV